MHLFKEFIGCLIVTIIGGALAAAVVFGLLKSGHKISAMITAMLCIFSTLGGICMTIVAFAEWVQSWWKK